MKKIITALLTLLFIISLAYADDNTNKTTGNIATQGPSTQSNTTSPKITKFSTPSTQGNGSTAASTGTGVTIKPYKPKSNTANPSTTGNATPYTNSKTAITQTASQQPKAPTAKVSPKQTAIQQPKAPTSQAVPKPTTPATKASPEQTTEQQPTRPATKATLEQTEVQIFSGKVVASVLANNETKAMSSNILVIDEKGQMWIFTVKSDTAITAKDGKALTLNEIKMDGKVVVEYKTVKEAQSIKLAE